MCWRGTGSPAICRTKHTSPAYALYHKHQVNVPCVGDTARVCRRSRADFCFDHEATVPPPVRRCATRRGRASGARLPACLHALSKADGGQHCTQHLVTCHMIQASSVSCSSCSASHSRSFSRAVGLPPAAKLQGAAMQRTWALTQGVPSCIAPPSARARVCGAASARGGGSSPRVCDDDAHELSRPHPTRSLLRPAICTLGTWHRRGVQAVLRRF